MGNYSLGKTCEQCGVEYHRPPRLNATLWAARRYCSRRCSTLAQTSAPHGCAVADCTNPARGAGAFCNRHRQRVRKHGDPNHRRWGDTVSRIMAKWIRNGQCWDWTGAMSSTGYGNGIVDGRRNVAHRLVYEMLVGPIPEGLQLDHLCRNKRCVNPAHLEPVTPRENIRRARAARLEPARG